MIAAGASRCRKPCAAQSMELGTGAADKSLTESIEHGGGVTGPTGNGVSLGDGGGEDEEVGSCRREQ